MGGGAVGIPDHAGALLFDVNGFLDFTSVALLGPRLSTFFEHGLVLNSQSVLRNDVTLYCLARYV